MSTLEGAASAPRPIWKNPFVVGFLVGAALLTVLPLLQRFALRAPPPLASLGEWRLPEPSGAQLSSQALRGKVWLLSVVPWDCQGECAATLDAFGGMLRHVDDLEGRVQAVTFVLSPGGQQSAAAQPEGPWVDRARGAWRFAKVPSEAPLPEPLRVVAGVLEKSPEAGSLEEGQRFFLVDQDGALRGMWPQDELGRGNLINAARLLARHGPAP